MATLKARASEPLGQLLLCGPRFAAESERTRIAELLENEETFWVNPLAESVGKLSLSAEDQGRATCAYAVALRCLEGRA